MSPSLRALGRLLSLAAFGLAAPAAAQTETTRLNNTLAEKFVIAPGGVDMRTGRYVYNETDLKIGGEGNGGLALTRTLTANAPNGHFNPFASLSHNWDIMVTESQSRTLNERNEYERFAHVHFGGRSQTFPAPKVSGSALAQISSGIAQSLSFEGDRAVGGVVYTYIAQDGTVAVFRPFGNDCGASCAFVSQITETDGTRFSFDYAPADGLSNGRVRLTRVTSSRGYALILEGSGYFVNKACVANLAKTGPVSSCPAGVPTATYEYVTLDKTRLAKVTGPDDAVSRFTYPVAEEARAVTGYVKPGYDTPWMTIATQVLGDELGVPQDIVQRQDFADGQSYSYAIESGPVANTGRAGGSYWNALSEQTDVKFDWPREPGQNTPGSLCRRLPCSGVEVDAEYSWVYQQTPGPATIADPLGNTTKFDHCEEAPMRLLPGNTLDRCIVFGAPLVVTDPEGVRTEFKYDLNLNAVWVKKHPKPGVLDPDGSVPAPIVTSALYDTARMSKSANKPLSMTDAKGNVTRWAYAPEHGGVLTETGPAVNGVPPQKRYAYVQRTVLVAGVAPAPTWALAQMSSCRTLPPANDGTGCQRGGAEDPSDEVVTGFEYGPDNGPLALQLLGQSVTADGQTLRTCFAYDDLGRKISETSPNGTAGLSSCPISAPASALPYTSSTRFDPDGRVTGTIAPDPDGPGGNGAPAVRNSYDPAGRLTKVEQGTLAAWLPESVAPAAWTGFTPHKVVETQYDALDRKTRESVRGDSVGSVTEYGYDLAGRLKCTAVRMNPDAWATPLADKCVPGPAHAVHGFDRISKTVYDKAGRPIESWDGVGTPWQRREAHYTYNSNGQKLSLTDARGFRAEMKYDAFDRQQRWVFPSKTGPGVADQSDYEQYLYDPNGNRTSLRKRDGSVLGFHYDALDRMAAKIVPERAGLSAAQTRDVHYGYDLRGLQTEARFDSLSGEGVSNVYDGFGRLVSTTTAMAGFSRTVSHLYDREGLDREITFPDGAKFWTDRDGLGRPVGGYQGAAGDSSTAMAVFYYNHVSNLYRFGRRWGSATNYEHDALGRLTRTDHGFNDAASSTTSVFDYNPAGQLRSESRSNDLYAWTGSVAVVRDYAANGQNQYTGTSSGAAFGYDPNGNLVSTVNAPWSTTYTYDVENRLVQASGTHNAALTYDPLGRLFQTWSPDSGATTRFLHDGDELVAEYDGSGTLLRRYIHGDGDDDPLYWYEGAGLSQPRFPHADRQSSIIAVAQPGGTLLWKNTYDEYGIPGAGNQGRFQYTGQAWIPELGLYYYKARIYSPYLGRFLQVDPIGYDDQFNLYAYVANDPINNTDPDGQVIETLWDVANVAMGVASAGRNIARGNYRAAAVDAAGVVADSLAVVLPGVPGGAGAAIRTVRAGDRVSGVASATGRSARAADRAALRKAGVPTSRARADVKRPNGAAVPKGQRQQMTTDSRGHPVVISRHGPHPGGRQPHDQGRHSHAATARVEGGKIERRKDGSVRYH